ncbi:hypothetical protein [Algoriphagus yeomjeoni]|uniref:Uncharacterized protein n=1 Tax=Algoriphagus yeomjeoni TaxID=291403 RepID=A0A327P2F4_9BACT|nr:hypothetical protein [Algoriphagus yeomjeoni]RAI85607.1 hypothetical protein LV83_03687 [Algoriphagus yeomjeoni]
MNTLVKRLPLFAFVLAAFAAFAFTGPSDPDPEFGLDGSTWRNVSGLTPGVDYNCNYNPEMVCTHIAEDIESPAVKPGIFVFPAE